MFRKFMLALAAAGALGAAALTPTTASAWGHHHHHGYWGLGGVGFVTYDSCLQKRWVDTRHGPRLRWVNVCY